MTHLCYAAPFAVSGLKAANMHGLSFRKLKAYARLSEICGGQAQTLKRYIQ